MPTPTPDLDPFFAQSGPFYDTEGARHHLHGISRQALAKRRERHTVLAMQTADGAWLYPAWQFTDDGTIHAALTPVLTALSALDGWNTAAWLMTSRPELGGKTPRMALAEGESPVRVAAMAAEDAATLTAP